MKRELLMELYNDENLKEYTKEEYDQLIKDSIRRTGDNIIKSVIVMEELAELQKEVSKFIRKDNENWEVDKISLLEEIVDVYMSLDMLRQMYDITDDEVKKMINTKCCREQQRIDAWKQEIYQKYVRTVAVQIPDTHDINDLIGEDLLYISPFPISVSDTMIIGKIESVVDKTHVNIRCMPYTIRAYDSLVDRLRIKEHKDSVIRITLNRSGKCVLLVDNIYLDEE